MSVCRKPHTGAAARSAIENDELRVTVLQEGGHIAEILGKRSGVNPLWTPPWPSIEPSTYDAARHPEYGGDAESRLLAGIMGHNLCLDIFGGPSRGGGRGGADGSRRGARWRATRLRAAARNSPCAPASGESQLAFERKVRLAGPVVEIAETVENLAATDRPIGWTQHVTLGPPFLEKGATRVPGHGHALEGVRERFRRQDFLKTGAEFEWPLRAAHGRRRRGSAGFHGRAGFGRVHHAPDGPGARARLFRGLLAARAERLSATCGGARISRGWASGKKTTAASTPPWNGRT